jgi:acetyl esterase/lipase
MSPVRLRWSVWLVLSISVVLGRTAWGDPPKEPTGYGVESGIFYLPEDEKAASDYAKEKCRLDLYCPQGITGFPTVIYFHGGGLSGGNRSIPEPLKNRGWAVVGAGYRLHPQVQHPVYIEDAAAAVAWTFQHIAERGGDPAKIFVTGGSAGGYLTAMVGLDKHYLAKHGIDANRIAGLIPVSGHMITHFTIRKEQGVSPDGRRPTIDEFAPLYHVRPDAPPTLCVTGGWEVDMLMRAEENLYFVRMMKLVGHKDVEQVVIEGADHGRACGECWPHVIPFIEKRLAAMEQPAPAPPAPEGKQ